MGEAIEMATVGHALDHLFGVHSGPLLIAGKVQGQDPQAVGAQGQQRVTMQPQAIELLALFQGHLIVAATEVDRQVPGDGAQLSGHVVALIGQGPGADEGFDGFGGAALGVVTGAAQGQFQQHLQPWADFGRGIEQGQGLAHITAVLVEQRQFLPQRRGRRGQADRQRLRP
ncbi:hypothetical protein D3C80_1613330 [compost metagenome]